MTLTLEVKTALTLSFGKKRALLGVCFKEKSTEVLDSVHHNIPSGLIKDFFLYHLRMDYMQV